MRKWLIFDFTFVTIILTLNIGFGQESSYRDFQAREVKSLSKEQIEGYLNGRGMGMALSAELNNYPGPKHVLELSDSLGINNKQARQIQEIFSEMHQDAIKLGKSVVEKEKRLNQLFASGEITDNSLASLINEIGVLNGKLRFTHLNAHLKTVAILDSTQIAEYSRLRGYGNRAKHHLHIHGNEM